ncbi:hypothetical protein [Sansalvadorimonas verongulae]|uniref:hypothetical protein n=1 Tax=Sansalvadorimonas verongulae TaxID=2172824 RepID=UPI0012BD1558|nr:hypothetical protein [Sansalvadorimonas verongulae]MTI12181.1 hypothetical protein [Sansalvadorimonas verongulae]
MGERQTVKGRIYLLAKRSNTKPDKISYQISGCEMPDLGYLTVDSREVEMNIPDDVDAVQLAIQELTATKTQIEQQARAEINDIEERLDILKTSAANTPQ